MHAMRCLVLLFCVIALPARAALPTPPPMDAKAWILVDHASGLTIASEAADQPLEPASVTKVMTALLVAEAIQRGELRPDERIKVSEQAWRAEGTRTFIDLGSKVAVSDLVRGMIVQSGNDAAVALAERLAGSEAAFAERMTARARELGAQSTRFRNASGLPDPAHRSTAHDLALITRELIGKHPAMYAHFNEREFTYNGIHQRNRNGLLALDKSADGVKTGFHEAAGYTLIGSAQRGTQRLIAVALGSPSPRGRDRAVRSLLDWGFARWEVHRLYGAAQPLGSVKVWKGATDTVSVGADQDVWVAVPRGRYSELKAYMEFAPRILAPIAPRAVLGRLRVSLGDIALTERPVFALETVPEGDALRRLVDAARLLIE
jgi:D-alanyl-D-alanine carboxypeptidase (penicillin-binding protein 5/6)